MVIVPIHCAPHALRIVLDLLSESFQPPFVWILIIPPSKEKTDLVRLGDDNSTFPNIGLLPEFSKFLCAEAVTLVPGTQEF